MPRMAGAAVILLVAVGAATVLHLAAAAAVVVPPPDDAAQHGVTVSVNQRQVCARLAAALSYAKSFLMRSILFYH